MTAKLYGIGVGPGDPELMTLKAVRLIGECDYVAVPKSGDGEGVAKQIARQAVRDFDQKQLLEVSMPMTRDPQVLEESHRRAAEQIEACLSAGKSVAFLTLGDPAIYSTYIYVHKRVRSQRLCCAAHRARYSGKLYRKRGGMESLARGPAGTRT